MKRHIAFLLIIITAISLTSCKKPGNNDNTSESSAESTAETSGSTTQTTTSETSTQPSEPIKGDLLASQEHDLDADGKDEYIRVLKNKNVHDGTTTYRSYLIIGNKENPDIQTIQFLETENDMSGVFSGLEFADIDNDGKDDIFITLQEAASPFTQNNFYVYSYSKDIGYSFIADTKFNMFCEAFAFEYAGDGWLKVTHSNYSFEARIPVKGGTMVSDAEGKKYEQSWVEPVPADIGSDSGTAVVESDGTVKIKVVLPVYGLATSDFIGKIEVFYRIDASFEQHMTSFAVFGVINGKLEQAAAVSID